MSFFSKLKKIAPFVQKGAVIASQAKESPVGAALAVVEMITESDEGSPETAVKAVAAAVDDHEQRLVEQDKRIAALEKALSKLKK